MATKRKARSEVVKASDIIDALSGVTKEKSIGIDLVLDTLKDALASGAKKYLGKPANVEVTVDRDKGSIEVYTRQYVADEVEDPEMQISLEEARLIDADLQVGDELIQDLDMDQFGRAAIQTAKQVIVQRVRELERDKIYADYSERIGELITGTVQQIEKGNILVNLGRTEALLPYREQIHKERYRQGDPIRGCILDVRNNLKGPQVIISRTSPMFLERLFELEVPEIFERIVRIVKIVRAPGQRAKVAVTSSDSRVDPVGACVGMRGNRVQAIVRELSNERMDIINWTDELSMLVRRVFSPAEVKRAIPVGETKLVVIISEEDLAQAIGKEGQNIKLASKMLDKEIDVYGDEEFAMMNEAEREQALAEPVLEPEEAAEGEQPADIFMTPTDQTDEETETEETDEQGETEESAGADNEEDSAGPSAGEDEPAQNGILEQATEELSESEQDVEEAMEMAEQRKELNSDEEESDTDGDQESSDSGQDAREGA
jgi:N utilization substance protein A